MRQALQPKLHSHAQAAGIDHEDPAVTKPKAQGIVQDGHAHNRTNGLVQPQNKAVPVPDCGVRLGWLLRWGKEVVLPRLGPVATTSQVCFFIPYLRLEPCDQPGRQETGIEPARLLLSVWGSFTLVVMFMREKVE